MRPMPGRPIGWSGVTIPGGSILRRVLRFGLRDHRGGSDAARIEELPPVFLVEPESADSSSRGLLRPRSVKDLGASSADDLQEEGGRNRQR